MRGVDEGLSAFGLVSCSLKSLSQIASQVPLTLGE